MTHFHLTTILEVFRPRTTTEHCCRHWQVKRPSHLLQGSLHEHFEHLQPSRFLTFCLWTSQRQIYHYPMMWQCWQRRWIRQSEQICPSRLVAHRKQGLRVRYCPRPLVGNSLHLHRCAPVKQHCRSLLQIISDLKQQLAEKDSKNDELRKQFSRAKK